MFKLSDLKRRRFTQGYPVDLAERILSELGTERKSFQELRRTLFGLHKLDSDDNAHLNRALADLEKEGRISRFGRGHGSTFYEFTFYEAVPPKSQS